MSRRRTRFLLHELLGRRVAGPDGRTVGRIEEIRAERRGDDHEITEFLLGPGALLERLSVVNRLVGRSRRTLIARWDQLDLSRLDSPRLTCPVEQLALEKPHAR